MSKPKAVLAATAALVGVIVVYQLLPDPSIRTPTADQAKQQSKQQSNQQVNEQGAALRLLKSARAERDATVWQQEVMAGRYESFFVELWDRLRNSHDAVDILAKLPLQTVILGKPSARAEIEHGIELFSLEADRRLTLPEWTEFVRTMHDQGYRLVQSEWHHARFEAIQPHYRSTVTVALHVVNETLDQRLIIKGDLSVEWSMGQGGSVPRPQIVDLSQLKILRRKGKPYFRLAATLPAKSMGATDFLGVYDLDGDGLSEILFGEHVFQNRGGGQFSARRLSSHRSQPLQSAVLADFNADGRTDLLCADPGLHAQLFLANEAGRFELPPQEIRALEPVREFSTSISVADVNLDGHLDVYLTQYKRPYLGGQMPSPYYDANDGYPSSLLINDGAGNFIDQTAEWGLAEKRHRRTYSSSFVDLDEDGDLDLVVVSDFAGLDIYQNQGDRFRDVTDELVDEPHNFGMSHTIADFNADGRLDLFVCGMGSTTARRLDAMGTGPPGRAMETKMRSVMGYGNRMYLSQDGRFVEPTFRDQVARTGWSWGVAELDFDNDGDRDIFVGNGHISGPSVKDYCSVFWRHDIYTGDSLPNPVREQLFLSEQHGFGQQGSWNGYEHNCLLMNRGGSEFVEVAFLLGLAHEFDTRSVVADDIDGNGLVDLLVIERPVGRPAILQVWKNYCENAGHWIGVVLSDSCRMPLPGVTVVVKSDQGDQIAQVVNGDSFNSQHAATLHFGLGKITAVDRLEITWPNGIQKVLRQPQLDRYHPVSRIHDNPD